MDLKMIKSFAEQGRYDEAIERCEEFLKAFPENTTDILRVRAYTFSLLGDYEKALKDREKILDSGGGTLRDYFLAAENALSLGRYQRAIGWLNQVLNLGAEQNEKWFEAAAYFLLAYTQMELGLNEEALISLDSAISQDPDCAMPLPRLGLWDHSRLKKEIQHRMRTE